MPRTDFKTLWAMYGKDDSTHKCNRKHRKKKDPKYEKLLDIVKHLAQKKNLRDSGNIEKATFKWTAPKSQQAEGAPIVPIPRDKFQSACRSLQPQAETVDYKLNWETKHSDYRNGELSIESWLIFADGKVDPLAVMEKLVRNGQVGGLGDTVEKPLYPTDEDAYGLFEIRDLSPGPMTDIKNILKKF
jgi:hypothetical protein